MSPCFLSLSLPLSLSLSLSLYVYIYIYVCVCVCVCVFPTLLSTPNNPITIIIQAPPECLNAVTTRGFEYWTDPLARIIRQVNKAGQAGLFIRAGKEWKHIVGNSPAIMNSRPRSVRPSVRPLRKEGGRRKEEGKGERRKEKEGRRRSPE
jgi:hypothetical protein